MHASRTADKAFRSEHPETTESGVPSIPFASFTMHQRTSAGMLVLVAGGVMLVLGAPAGISAAVAGEGLLGAAGNSLCMDGNWTGSFAHPPKPPANKDTYRLVQTSASTFTVATADEKWARGNGTFFQRADGTYYVSAVLTGTSPAIQLTGWVSESSSVWLADSAAASRVTDPHRSLQLPPPPPPPRIGF